MPLWLGNLLVCPVHCFGTYGFPSWEMLVQIVVLRIQFNSSHLFPPYLFSSIWLKTWYPLPWLKSSPQECHGRYEQVGIHACTYTCCDMEFLSITFLFIHYKTTWVIYKKWRLRQAVSLLSAHWTSIAGNPELMKFLERMKIWYSDLSYLQDCPAG